MEERRCEKGNTIRLGLFILFGLRLSLIFEGLNLVACFFILQIVFGLCPLISCDLSKERVDLINWHKM